MEVNLIVAAGRDGSIGKDGDLIWKIREDLMRFKRLTMGHPVIMGRKTWESLPKRPLPGRDNIVLSRDKGYVADGGTVCTDVSEVLRLTEGKDPFVIGGEQIYHLFLPYVTRIHVTEIDAECGDADAYFPIPTEGWELAEATDWGETSEGVRYRYLTYQRM